MTFVDTVRFAGTLVGPVGTAARKNAVYQVRSRLQARHVPNSVGLTSFDPMNPTTAASPFAAYRRFHDGPRVHYNPDSSLWILSRLDDVRSALLADSVLSSEDGITRTIFGMPVVLTTDGERHAALRRQILPGFSRAALDSWRPKIDALAAELVGDVLANPDCDVVERLTVPMPVRLIAYVLGVPDSDVYAFRNWSEAAAGLGDVTFTRRGAAKMTAAVKGMQAIYTYLHQQFRNGRLHGSDTLLGRLLTKNDEGSLGHDEMFFIAMILLVAGNETTTNLLGAMFDTLAREPDSYDRIRADHSLIPAAVEEQLRYSSPLQNLHRTALADYTVGDVTIPAGARVSLSFGAANRDPRVFDDPDSYHVDRNPAQHIAFGHGPHLCLGAQLARMETQAVLRELANRVGRIEPASETRWSTNSMLRGPQHLRIKLTPR
jgi:cytochrome P450